MNMEYDMLKINIILTLPKIIQIFHIIFAKIKLIHPTPKRQEKTEPLGKNLVYNRRKWYTGGKRSGNISEDLRRNQAVPGDIRVRAAANSAAAEYRQKVLGRNDGAVGTQARQRTQKRCSDR